MAYLAPDTIGGGLYLAPDEPPALTRHTLAGSAATQANTSSVGAAAQRHVLAGSPSSQANTSAVGQIGIGVRHVLTGSPCSQANVSPAGAITISDRPFVRSQARTYAVGIDERTANPPTFKKVPSAILDYSFDWAAYLSDADDEIASCAIDVPPAFAEGVEILVDSVATTWISGGVAGYKHHLRCDIVTAQGRRDSRTIIIDLVAER